MLIAHITEKDGQRIEQPLEDHCRQTAEYAVQSIGGAKFHNTAYLAGICHDMGKFQRAFREYLEKSFDKGMRASNCVIHTFQGCAMILDRYHSALSIPSCQEKTKDFTHDLTAEIIAYVIGAHHGLFDMVDKNSRNGFKARLERCGRIEKCVNYSETFLSFTTLVMSEEEMDEAFRQAAREIQWFWKFLDGLSKRGLCDEDGKYFYTALLIRLILSAVMYGDRRDSKEFSRQSELPDESADWKECRSFLKGKLKSLEASGGDKIVNQVRGCISRQCEESAERIDNLRSMYCLCAPPGSGKTAGGLLYAVAHADIHRKRRIVFVTASPEAMRQTASQIRGLLPENVHVLEYDADVIREQGDEETPDRFEVLTNTWDAPVIVCTLSQFLSVFYSDNKSDIARMQSLCDSVIVVEDAETVPVDVTILRNRALNFLCLFCNTTVLLSSSVGIFKDKDKREDKEGDKSEEKVCVDSLLLVNRKRQDIVTLNEEQLKAFPRPQTVDLTDKPDGQMNLDQLAEVSVSTVRQDGGSLLVICNTGWEVRKLTKLLKERTADKEDCEVFCLTNGLCQAHREKVLGKMRERLDQVHTDAYIRKEHCLICVSDSSAEADGNLPFRYIIRLLAGTDSLLRTIHSDRTGTCEKVFVADLTEEHISCPKEIKAAKESAKRSLPVLRDKDASWLTDRKAAEEYFRDIYKDARKTKEMYCKAKSEGSVWYLADLLSNQWRGTQRDRNRELHLRQPFKFVGKLFSTGDQSMVRVVTRYGEGKDIVDELVRLAKENPEDEKMTAKLLKEAKPYTAEISWSMKCDLEEDGMLKPILGGRVLVLETDAYDEEFGLCA